MKFPKRIRHRGRVLATIYGKSHKYPRYRVAYYVAGRRRQRTFRTYSEAKTEADKQAKDIAKGSVATALTSGQARDALAALEQLQALYESTGRKISLLSAVSEYANASAKLRGRTMGEAVEGYLNTVANVMQKNIKDAVEEFIKAEESRTRASNGQRPQLSAKYAYNRAIQLRRFAATFLNTPVCELSKEHLDAFVTSLGQRESKSRNHKRAVSAKSRNHHRAALKQFLHWAARKDYLAVTHRLFEADSMRPEHANDAEIAFYTSKEFRALLEAAEGPMRAIVAIGGLAGLRTAELLRLDWSDVWRVPGHIEVTAGKSKTRARRLVRIVPALAAWLRQFRNCREGKLCILHEITFQQHFVELCRNAKVDGKPVARKPNGLRHAFCTYHFAQYANENLTAALAGNSPAMIHAHYKGLATKSEAKKWFALSPVKKDNVIVLRTTAK